MAKILVVDDSLIMRKALAKIILNGGHEVAGEAKSGEDGIVKYKELSPDLVIMDVNMDGMDGITACSAIVLEFKNAKIIICSSQSDSDVKASALSAGAREFVLKPFVEADILTAITATLG